MFEIKKKERGAIPPPPPELRDADIEIEYVSPLIRAQQSQKIQEMLQAVQEVNMIGQVFPQVMDILDGDALARNVLENRGVPQSCIRAVQEVMQLRQQKMQAQEDAQRQMQEQQLIQGAMQGYQGLSKAPEYGSPAQSILSQASGGM